MAEAGLVVAILALVLSGIVGWATWRQQQRSTSLQADQTDLQKRMVSIEEARRHEEVEGRQRGQADKVTAWVQPGHLTASGTHFVRMKISNTSNEPVMDCRITVRLHGAETQRDLTVVGAGEVPDVDVPVSAPPQPGGKPTWVFEFTDNHGARWRRTSDGELAQINGDGGFRPSAP